MSFRKLKVWKICVAYQEVVNAISGIQRLAVKSSLVSLYLPFFLVSILKMQSHILWNILFQTELPSLCTSFFLPLLSQLKPQILVSKSIFVCIMLSEKCVYIIFSELQFLFAISIPTDKESYIWSHTHWCNMLSTLGQGFVGKWNILA